MLITYFDEVKTDPVNQHSYWIGGLVMPAESIWRIERRLNDLAKEVFQSSALTVDTEFHAADLFHQKKHFKKWDLSKRLETLCRMIDILNEETGFGKVFVRMNLSNMIFESSLENIQSKAFMYFVERVEKYLQAKKSPGLLIGDKDSDSVSSSYAKNLARYRAQGTPYHFGIELKNLIDTVHFTRSHHCRLLQMADLYVWLLQLCSEGDHEKYPRKKIIEYVKTTNILIPDRYKDWPTKESWLYQLVTK